MRSFIQLILIQVFLTASLLMGGFIVGPFSIRIYVSVILLIYLILNGYKFPFMKEVVFYTFFISFYLVALFGSGEINNVGFLKYFLSRYFICFISVYVMYCLVENSKLLDHVVIFLISIGVLNGATSLMQFFGYSDAFLVPMFFNPAEEAIDRLNNYMEIESGLGFGVVGLFGNIVKNGYLSAVFAALSLYLFERSKGITNRIFAFGVMLFLLYAVFLTQQRLVTLATIGFYLFYFYYNKKLFYSLVLLIIPVIVLQLYIEINVNPDKLGRLAELNDMHRLNIYSLGLRFIGENFLFGGQNAFARLLYDQGYNIYSAHNFFLNAFIYSGLFGAIFVSIVYFNMLLSSFRVFFKPYYSQAGSVTIFLSGSLVIYLINSLTHNASLVTGDEYIWILFTLLFKSELFDKQVYFKRRYYEYSLRYR